MSRPKKEESITLVTIKRVNGQRINASKLIYFQDKEDIVTKIATYQEVDVPENIYKQMAGVALVVESDHEERIKFEETISLEE